MAAVSNFGYDRASRHERLLSELTYEILKEEVRAHSHNCSSFENFYWRIDHSAGRS
jgi:hypothetical protein